MRRICLALALLLAAHRSVRAEAAPFTDEELRAALAARGVTADVAVAIVEDGLLEVTTADGAWQVRIGDARGAAAARLVALHVAVEPDGPVAAPPEVAVVDEVRAEAPVATAAPTAVRWRIDSALVGATGVQADDLSLRGLRVDVGRRAGRWRIAAGAGWLRGGDALSADLALVRATAGVAIGRLELGAGPVAGVLLAGGAGGATIGLGATARIGWPLGDRATLLVGVDADAVHRRVIARLDGAPFASTPRVSIAAIAGIGVEL